MQRRPERASDRSFAAVAALLAPAALLAAACTSLEAYSVRAAERSCGDLEVCTVYGKDGEHEKPCTQVGKMTVYPGDPLWPYTTPGVCDAVKDGQVISTRDLTGAPGSTVK